MRVAQRSVNDDDYSQWSKFVHTTQKKIKCKTQHLLKKIMQKFFKTQLNMHKQLNVTWQYLFLFRFHQAQEINCFENTQLS